MSGVGRMHQGCVAKVELGHTPSSRGWGGVGRPECQAMVRVPQVYRS